MQIVEGGSSTVLAAHDMLDLMRETSIVFVDEAVFATMSRAADSFMEWADEFRLGITYPEITEMQARATFEAVVQVAKKGVKVIPEVMISLIGGVKESENQKKIVVAVAEEVLAKAGMKGPRPAPGFF
jgi:phosphoenolpyruvate synthase/pyruvate phosphate dikinase